LAILIGSGASAIAKAPEARTAHAVTPVVSVSSHQWAVNFRPVAHTAGHKIA
jgi:hypothetical protein